MGPVIIGIIQGHGKTAAQVMPRLAAIDSLDTGVRGGPEPEAITLENFGRDIPEV